ncbi:RyR domain-containing protein [Actinomadura hibisca]|uniref:RyR domain-containing protein n=1 Tax=Actinomadura hibisca TaxID=68565 RepID=UPI00083061BC|nr:RyR domain-containing protein [Actinomadura hibisca]
MSRRAILRLLFGLAAPTALLLGVVGFEEYLQRRPDLGRSAADVLYYSLQLYVLDPTPLDGKGPYPVALEIARFLAPAVTVYAIVDAVWTLCAERLRRFRLSRARGHCLVSGDGPAPRVLAERLAAAGERVITIGPAGEGAPLHRRHLSGDATDGDLLLAAGLRGAKALYAFGSESAANARVALTAQRLLPGRKARPFRTYMYVNDPDLCQVLRARRLGLGGSGGFRLDFFNPAQIAARVLLETHPLNPGDRSFLVLGLNGFGRETVVELARQHRLLEPAPGTPDGARRPVLTAVDRDARRILDGLVRRYPILRSWETVAIDLAPEDFRLDEAVGDAPPDRTILCHRDPDLALHTALASVRLWRGAPGSIVVAVDQDTTYGRAFAARDGGALLDGLAGRLVVHGVLDAACDPARIGDDLIEQLARAIHDHYVVNQTRRGRTRWDNPALVPWARLPEDLRTANREQALGISGKLAAVGATLAPHVGEGPPFCFEDEEVELLARVEHVRWVEERGRAGWSFGPHRDDERRLHPQMKDWAALDEENREKDRDAVRALPRILADAGFQIVRLPRTAPDTGGTA